MQMQGRRATVSREAPPPRESPEATAGSVRKGNSSSRPSRGGSLVARKTAGKRAASGPSAQPRRKRPRLPEPESETDTESETLESASEVEETPQRKGRGFAIPPTPLRARSSSETEDEETEDDAADS